MRSEEIGFHSIASPGSDYGDYGSCRSRFNGSRLLYKSKVSHYTSQVLLRSATAADIPRLRALDQSAPHGVRWTEAHYADLIARHDEAAVVLVAEVQGDPIAYVAAAGVTPESELENIVVRLDYLRRGVARALLEELLERLRRAGTKRLHLEVRDSNAPARALYRSLGFTEVGRRPAYYSTPTEDAVLLSLSL